MSAGGSCSCHPEKSVDLRLATARTALEEVGNLIGAPTSASSNDKSELGEWRRRATRVSQRVEKALRDTR